MPQTPLARETGRTASGKPDPDPHLPAKPAGARIPAGPPVMSLPSWRPHAASRAIAGGSGGGHISAAARPPDMAAPVDPQTRRPWGLWQVVDLLTVSWQAVDDAVRRCQLSAAALPVALLKPALAGSTNAGPQTAPATPPGTALGYAKDCYV
jgi:hypothetical protein